MANRGRADGAGLQVNRTVHSRRTDEQVRSDLRQNEELFRGIFDNSPIGIALVGLDDHFLQVNQSLCTILGYSREELLKTTIEALTHPEDMQGEAEQKTKTIRGENSGFQIEKRYLHADGHIVWGQLSVSLVRDVQGKPIYYLGQLEDITRRKEAIAALQESEQRYRSLASSAQRQAQELALLDRVRTTVAREVELPLLFQTVIEGIVETFGYTQVSIYLLQNDLLVLQHQIGYETVINPIQVNQGIMGRVVRTRTPVLLEDVHSDPAFLGAIQGVTSEVCVPLFDQDQAAGALNVESTQGVVLSEADLRLMVALSENVSIAITRARLFASLRASESRFRALIEHGTDIISILDATGKILYISPSVARILGYATDEITGRNSMDLIHPDDASFVRISMEERINNPGSSLTIRYRFHHKDGSWRWFESTGTNLLADPTVQGIVVNSSDITEQKRTEERLVYDAHHDALTGLPNRALFAERLEHVLLTARRSQDLKFAVLFLDLDQFKVINDTFGHTAGDQILVAIARRLEASMRPSDTFARLGGDEFIALLEGIDSVDKAILVAERIQAHLAIPFDLHGLGVVTSASIGIVWGGSDYQRPDDVFRDADIAMYRAKSLGKSRFQVFEPAQ